MSGLGTAGASAPPKHPTAGAALVECGSFLRDLADTVQYSLRSTCLLAIQTWVKEVEEPSAFKALSH